MRWISFASLLVLAACPPSLRKPESSQLVLTGSVYAGGFERRGETLSNATLTVRRADTGEELASNVTSSAGGYRFALTVTAGTRVVLIAEAAGFAPFARAFTVGPYTELTTSFSLEPLATLECLDTGCLAPQAELSWQEPPGGASGSVTSFDLDVVNPVQVAMSDDAQVLAMGFARLSGTGGRLALRVPLSAWPRLVDARPGTQAIEVETALFDPKKGSWARGAAVELRSEAGDVLPEAALTSLQRQDFAGGAVAELSLASEQFLAVLGAARAVGCVSGTVTVEGKAAPGLSLTLPDSEPSASGADGAFCASVPVGDGSVTGVGQYAGLPYSLGAIARPTTTARCGGACRDVGTLALDTERLEVAAMCRFTGRVVDTQGQPVPNAEVIAFDDSVASNAQTTFCGQTGTRCSLTRPSGADGTFTLNGPMLGSLYVGARVTGMSGTSEVARRGGLRVTSCPTEPLTLRLGRGEDRLEVSATFIGNAITWLPPRAAARVTVMDAQGTTKWEVRSPIGLTPPLTFGTAPADAIVMTAPVGTATTGDTVVIELDGMGRDGVVYLGVGTGTRP
jgi:hypothetical protein